MSYRIETEINLDQPIDRVFAFFADAGNLEAITPPELKFRILTPRPIEMRVGALIEYRLSLYGIPFSWLTEISVWEPGVRFVDRQIRGPFRVWHHEHRFTSLGPTRTAIHDTVTYVLPLEPLGRVAHGLVRQSLDRIFDYRTERVPELIGATETPAIYPRAAAR